MKQALLTRGAEVAARRGFAAGLLAESCRALQAMGRTVDHRALAAAFPRGFDVAVVEHIVDASNAAAETALLAKYDKHAIIENVVRCEDMFVKGVLQLPSDEAVLQTALAAKLGVIMPYRAHWPRAVALEWRPSNVPFTVLKFGAFVDTTCYHMERVSTLRTVLQPARQLLLSRRMTRYVAPHHTQSSTPRSGDTAAVLHAFVDDMPLAAAPHHADGTVNASWFARRGKVAAVYCATLASAMGDDSAHALESRTLSRHLISSLF